jgi:serine/threonine protein kinase/Tol biopolymer transport system component
MKCPRCNSEVLNDSRFCSKCGTPINASGKASASLTKSLQTPASQTIQGKVLAGKYKILEEIGRGGMGVVYKAEDTGLDRPVAIKVLPDAFTSDPERLARFEREAKLLAALSHPNIASIYGLDEAEGKRFLVLEFVEGETLAERLMRGPLSFDGTLDICRQISEGLEAAHEKGIIHRDLKPANVKITPDGKVKVLDFGLAKAFHNETSAPDRSQSPTITDQMTSPGVIMGTVAYMSPEQAAGKPVDKRSDIWAFGVVLYEMLIGERLFSGENAVDVLGAVMRQEIDFGRLPQSTPRRLRELVRRCLERNSRNRLRDIGDARIVLEEVLAAGAEPEEPTSSLAPEIRTSRHSWLAVAAIAAVAVGAGFLIGHRIAGVDASASTASPKAFRQLTDAPGGESAPTLSPDGKDVVFVGSTRGNLDLYLLHVGDRSPRLLTANSTEDNWQPAFSPNGERIAFRSERGGGGIFVMSSTGESVRRLTDFGFNPTWSPDGREIGIATTAFAYPTDMFRSRGDLVVVNIESGVRRLVAKGLDPQQPHWSPHGQRIAYWATRGSGGQRDLFTVAADGSEVESGAVEATNDTALDWSPAWSPDGRWLYFSSSRGGTMNLWRLPIEEASGRVTGDAQPVTAPAAWNGGISFARDGRHFAFASLDFRSTLLRVGFDARSGSIVGSPERMLQSNLTIRDHELSPDGKWVVMNQRGENEDLAVARTDGSDFLRLTDDPFRDRCPRWSPDGRQIAFYSDREGGYEIWSMHPDGSGLERLTTSSGRLANQMPVWSPDGAQLAYTKVGEGWSVLDMRSSARPRPSRAMPPIGDSSFFWPLSWSPDGTRLAGQVGREDGMVVGVVVYSVASSSYQRVLESADLKFLWMTWLSDSRRLLVRDEHGISLLDTATRENRRLIAVGGYWMRASVGVTRDDRWITWTETATEGDIWLAELGAPEKRL